MTATCSARRDRTAVGAALCVAMAALVPAAASAVPGAPDTTFGPGGLRSDATVLQGDVDQGTSVDPYEGFLREITALSGSRLAISASRQCGLECGGALTARYLSTGRRDTGFATNGLLRLLTFWDAFWDGQTPQTVWTPPVIAFDGSMLTMGGGRLVRYRPDGTVASDTASAGAFVPVSMAAAGRIVGQTEMAFSGQQRRYTVGLYRPDGSVDPTVRPVIAVGTQAPAVSVARGSLWVAFPTAARAGMPAGRSVRLVRRRLDGTGGTSTRLSMQSPGTRRTAKAVEWIRVGRTGRVTLLCGMSRAQVLVGVSPDGSRNRRFGSDGLVSLHGGSAAAVQRDGRIVVATASSSSTGSALTVRRLTAAGKRDELYRVHRFSTAARLMGPRVTIDDDGRAVIAFATGAADSTIWRLRLLRLLGK